MNVYEELYRLAWEHWKLYWLETGVEADIDIQFFESPKGKHLRTYTIIRGKSLLIHQIEINRGPNVQVWQLAMNDLIKAGAVKMYESTVMLNRNHLAEDKYKYKMFPITVDESYPVKLD